MIPKSTAYGLKDANGKIIWASSKDDAKREAKKHSDCHVVYIGHAPKWGAQ
jgi:hypothetical protein